jgi:RNA polymerase sigma-70 factor (ECF subfamily)
VRAWQLADINAFVELVAEDIRFSMPPLSAWFDGRAAVTAFVEAAIFSTARPHGVAMRAGRCNGQPAFATYEPDAAGRLVANGLQVLEIADRSGRLAITAIVSFRDPGLARRCGLPPAIP